MYRNLRSILYKIVFIILFFVLAKSCVSDYVNGEDENKIAELEQMINDKSLITADLSNEYTERTIARVVKLYKFDYSFRLNEKLYSGKITLNEIPNTTRLNLYYLIDDPNIISADPYEDLKTEKEKGNSISDLLVGVIWGILAILLLISLIAGKKSEEVKSTERKPEKKISKTTEKIVESAKEVSTVEKQEQEHLKKENPNRFMPK